ncbi:hypothetical protein MHK_005406 [Candidatus Magnetomorum sp. HK-1]|nr:hypothetical protein MHK_005406 [Candidatus Magnetomorum sp. HK-1]
MSEKQLYLLDIGIPSIKKYVFATNRLKSIRGASALLADLNQEEFIMGILNDNKHLSDIKCFSAGGGAAQFIVTGTAEDVDNSMDALSKKIAQKTGNGLKMIYGKALYSQDKYQLARKLAFYESNHKRDENPILPTTILHTGFARECDDCSNMINKENTSNETYLLCNVCQKKIKFNDDARKGLWFQFSDFLKEKDVIIDQSKDFQDIGKHCRARKNYTAVVYADGNSMGKIIQKIHTPEDFKFFSDTVEKAIKESCFEALYETSTKLYQPSLPSSFPGEILLLGGDDLIVYLTAEMAFPFALDVARRFNEKTIEAFDCQKGSFFKEITNGKGLTISLGIAYGKVNTPISLMLNQAESLLTSAKTSGSKDQPNLFYAPTFIDFHISTNFNQIDISQCRKNYLHLAPNMRLYQKPYALEDAQTLYDHAKKLAREIPGTRLKRLGASPTMGKVNGTLETLKLYTSTPKGKQRQLIWDAFSDFRCIENMPWKSEDEHCQSTMIIDLVELAGFIGN